MATKKKDTKKLFGGLALLTFVAALALAIYGMSRSMSEIRVATISHTPEAILASAGVAEGENVFLSVAYFDQKADDCVNMYDTGSKAALSARQFEWSECGYDHKALEQGMVKYELDEDYLPVAVGGRLTSNQGLKDMARWFEAVEGKSASYTGNLKMDYRAEGAEFTFYKDEFYPLDEVTFSQNDKANSDGHNHLFTMNFAVPFTVLASGGESFEITADDDTFVFVGDKLALDLGGIHGAMSGRFRINEKGEVYAGIQDEDLSYTGITVGKEDGSAVRIFHADRDSGESVFKVKFRGMNLSVTDAKLANRKDEGVQIAYDPTDPTYMAPLGETSVVEPDGTKGHIIIATIEGVMIVTFAVLTMIAVRNLLRQRANRKNR